MKQPVGDRSRRISLSMNAIWRLASMGLVAAQDDRTARLRHLDPRTNLSSSRALPPTARVSLE